MGRKKQQMSEFYFFMVEKKPEVEKRMGRSVSMAELPSFVYMEWQALPEAKKQKYKALKEKSRGTAEKLDCRGLPLAELKRREEEEKKKVEEMIQSIVNTIDVYNSSNALHRATFYIISTNYYVRTEDDCFSPAEIGLVQFSFERGIIREHHVIVAPVIPTGYGYLSQQHSEATHNLLEENNFGVDDKLEVFQGLKDFVIEEGSRLPPLYTLDEEMVHTEAIINDIAGMEYFRIFSLDKLFQHLYSTTFPEHPIPQSVAKDMLTNCSLDYHPAIACEWHINYQKDAGKYCSLSCARRWVFLMCDNMNLADTFGVEPSEDKHLPRAIPSCGVLVDVPRTTFKKERVTSRALDPAQKERVTSRALDPAQKEQVTSHALDPAQKERVTSRALDPAQKERVTSRALDPAQKERVTSRAPDQAESPWNRKVAAATGTSSPRACSASSLFSRKLDTSYEEEFPALGAGVAHKDADGSSSSSAPTASGGLGGRFKPDDEPHLGLPGVGRSQSLQWPKPKKKPLDLV